MNKYTSEKLELEIWNSVNLNYRSSLLKWLELKGPNKIYEKDWNEFCDSFVKIANDVLNE